MLGISMLSFRQILLFATASSTFPEKSSLLEKFFFEKSIGQLHIHSILPRFTILLLTIFKNCPDRKEANAQEDEENCTKNGAFDKLAVDHPLFPGIQNPPVLATKWHLFYRLRNLFLLLFFRGLPLSLAGFVKGR